MHDSPATKPQQTMSFLVPREVTTVTQIWSSPASSATTRKVTVFEPHVMRYTIDDFVLSSIVYSYLAPWAKTISFEGRAEDCCSLVL